MAKKVFLILLLWLIPTALLVGTALSRQTARFEDWVNQGRRKRRIEAGYQNEFNDKGNWTGGAIGMGRQIGTNRSISAPVLQDWLGYEPSLQDMKNLSVRTAKAIYKAKFWQPIQGDKIQSQLIANFIADMRSSAGYNGIKELQKALNRLGESLDIDGVVGEATLGAINRQIRLSEKRLNNTYHQQMVDYYTRIGTGTNAGFKDNWIASLQRDYPIKYA